ncbi:MAG: alpha/beta hydrolase [Flammeovirgaceae bacterium]|jgi:pimeloyl-ACP methyl ester carboxylesterase|nr:alpha/beta hydrolase [Flammeovirgaceae bacterium]
MISNATPIVFIHGLHENSVSWINWIDYFTKAGYNCHAPVYPYHDGEPKDVRRKPHPKLARIKFKDVVQHYCDYVDKLKNKPILIGHAMGGLVVQKLIQADKGTSGVCITSALPRGIFSLNRNFILSTIGIVNPFMGDTIYLANKKWYRNAICNTLPQEESDFLYENHVVPESRNILRSSRGKDGNINFTLPHAPLLFIGAEQDNILPIGLTIKNKEAYTHESSITDFKAFRNRCHAICLQDGWEEVAAYIKEWIKKNK